MASIGCRLCYNFPLPGTPDASMPTSIYKVIFHNQGQIYEIYARQIFESDLHGFIEAEEFAFGKRSEMVVDPSEEKLKAEFSGVRRTYIPVHAIVRIDEVEKEGVVKISDFKGAVAPFPMPTFNPKRAD